MRPFAFFVRVLNPDKDGYGFASNCEEFLRAICDAIGIDLRNAEDYNSVGQITNQIKEALERADVVFAELSSSNENVWYEVGYTDRIDEGKVVALIPKGHRIPFDRMHMRSFVIDFGNLRTAKAVFYDKVKVACAEIIGVARIIDLLKRSDYSDEAIPEYLLQRPQFASIGIGKLRDIARDVRESSEIRRRAVSVLFTLEQITDDMLVPLTHRLVNADVRQEVFDAIAEIDRRVPDGVWTNALSAKRSVPVMRSAARASTLHYLRGYLSEDSFFGDFLKHPRWEFRKHIATTLFAETRKDWTRASPVVDALLHDHAPEVRNRIVDWLMSLKERGAALDDGELQICKRINNEYCSTKSNMTTKMCLTLADLLK